MAFEPNPNYWGPKPTITHADFIIYDDPLTKGLPAYENNELDTAQVSPGDYDRVLKDAKLSKELKGYPLSQTNMIHVRRHEQADERCPRAERPLARLRPRPAD